MEIIENDLYIDITENNKTYHYNKPNYIGYDYKNLILTLFELNIKNVRIGIRSCNIVSKNKILKKLKNNFGQNNIIFTGSYKDKIYQYNIKLLDDENYLIFKELNK